MGRIMDFVFGSPEKQETKPLPQPVVPFLTGLGPNPGMSWQPQYNPAMTYNPYAFIGGNPYGTGDPYAWANPYRMDQDAWAYQRQINNGVYNPTPGAQPGTQNTQPGTQPGGAPSAPGSMGMDLGPMYYGAPQQPGSQPGTSYQPGYENGIYSGAEGNIPGLFPSAAWQAMYGPQQYYPWMDVAGKTIDQQTADNWLRNFVDGRGQELLGDVNQTAHRLINGNYLDNPIQQRSSQYARDLMDQGLGQDAMDAGGDLMGLSRFAARYARQTDDPEFQKDFGKYGLGRYTQGYDENPYLTNAINDASSDAIRNTMEGRLRQDRENAIQAGQYGGARSGISEGITNRGLAEELGQLATQSRFQDYTGWQDRGLRAGEALMQGDVAAQNAATARAQIESNHRLGMMNALTNLMTGGSNMYGMGADAAIGAGDLGNDASGQAFNLDTLRQRGMESGAGLIQDVIDGKVDLNSLLRDVGSRDQALNQLFISSDKNRWDFGQQAPWDLLGQWSQILGIGNQATTTRQDSGGGQAGVLDFVKAIFPNGIPGLGGD